MYFSCARLLKKEAEKVMPHEAVGAIEGDSVPSGLEVSVSQCLINHGSS